MFTREPLEPFQLGAAIRTLLALFGSRVNRLDRMEPSKTETDEKRGYFAMVLRLGTPLKDALLSFHTWSK